VASLNFQPAAEAVRRVLPAVRQAAPDLVILLAHEGASCDSGCRGEIVDAARGLDSTMVDLIAAGHTHVPFQTMVNGIPITNSGSFGTGLAVADVWRRADGRREVRTRLHTVWTDSIRPDSAMAALVARHRQQVDRIAARPVAELKLPLTKRDGEFALGHLIADAQRAAARADVAIMNNGGIGGSLPAGPVNYGQLSEVHPFSNQLVKLSLRGDTLLRALEHVVGGSGVQASVSGVQVWYNGSRRPGQRITRTRLADGREIRSGERYTLAVSDFLAEGGDGFTMLTGARPEPAGTSDLDALIGYLQRLPRPIEIPEANRIHSER
jgi:5'-nucleotidase